jgi:hypothetical protein
MVNWRDPCVYNDFRLVGGRPVKCDPLLNQRQQSAKVIVDSHHIQIKRDHAPMMGLMSELPRPYGRGFLVQ